MKKREAMTRARAAFQTTFSGMTDCEILPQQQTGAAHSGMSREAAIASAQWETKAAAGEWIICADPKFSYDSGNGACGCAPPLRITHSAIPDYRFNTGCGLLPCNLP